MQFWDSSAIVPLLVAEDSTARLLQIHAAAPDTVSSFLTPVEVSSAIWRRRHANLLTAEQHLDADRLFAVMSIRWSQVEEIDEVIAGALMLLSRHHLRAGDAIQLASALVASDGIPSALPFVTLDRDLATAARAEGFPVLP